MFDASLITGIDPPPEVESALAAINTAHNQVSSDISLAQAARGSEDRAIAARGGDRDAEGAGRGGAAASCWLRSWRNCKNSGPDVLGAYLRNVRLALFDKASADLSGGAP